MNSIVLYLVCLKKRTMWPLLEEHMNKITNRCGLLRFQVVDWKTQPLVSGSLLCLRPKKKKKRQQVLGRFWAHLLEHCAQSLSDFSLSQLVADAPLCQWNDLDGFSSSPGVDSFHCAAGGRGAPTAEERLGPTSLRRAAERKDCYSHRSQYRLVGFDLLTWRQTHCSAVTQQRERASNTAGLFGCALRRSHVAS